MTVAAGMTLDAGMTVDVGMTKKPVIPEKSGISRT
jgi:hypothetical protein